jgi:hypothetical protein
VGRCDQDREPEQLDDTVLAQPLHRDPNIGKIHRFFTYIHENVTYLSLNRQWRSQKVSGARDVS